MDKQTIERARDRIMLRMQLSWAENSAAEFWHLARQRDRQGNRLAAKAARESAACYERNAELIRAQLAA